MISRSEYTRRGSLPSRVYLYLKSYLIVLHAYLLAVYFVSFCSSFTLFSSQKKSVFVVASHLTPTPSLLMLEICPTSICAFVLLLLRGKKKKKGKSHKPLKKKTNRFQAKCSLAETHIDVVFLVAQTEVVHDGSFVQLCQCGHVLYSMDAAGVHRVHRLSVQFVPLQMDHLKRRTHTQNKMHI